LAQIGFWAMGMRSMMVTIQGEDYMLQAEAKGLKNSRVFYRYAVRNAILPQVTGLALNLGTIISGAILVEVVFSYPGVGGALLLAVRHLCGLYHADHRSHLSISRPAYQLQERIA